MHGIYDRPRSPDHIPLLYDAPSRLKPVGNPSPGESAQHNLTLVAGMQP